MIATICSVCGAPVQFHESAAGSKKRCPKCKSIIRVRHLPASGLPRPKRREKPHDRTLPSDSE